MKVILRLTILVAALLLVTNMAFAQIIVCINPICYDIIATDVTGNTNTDYWIVCLNNNGTGSLYSNNTLTHYNLYLFGGGPGWSNTSGDPAFGGKPNWSIWIANGSGPTESGFIQPIGEGLLLTGAGESNGNRYTVQGKRVPCDLE
jgi:hypothetical protein